MKELKLAIFDLDGTLIRLEHEFLFSRAIEVLASFGITDVTEEALEGYFKDHNFFGYIDVDERRAFEVAFWKRFNEVHLPPPVAFDETMHALDHCLSQGWKIAIATARTHPVEEVTLVLKETGILPYVSYLSTWADEDWVDKITQIHKVCRALSVQPEESCMVGDSPTDLIGAHGAGSRLAIGVLSGGVREEVLLQHNPHILIPDVGHLPESFEEAEERLQKQQEKISSI